MKQGSGKLVATILAILTLALPGSLSAANWRGIDIIVTTQDGRQFRGELIAVKPDSLVLLDADRKDLSILVAEIKNIKVRRRSKAFQGMLYGFLAGAVGGAIWGGIAADDEWGVAGGAFLGGLFVAPPASLLGLVAGMGAGLDDEIDLAGLPEPELDRILAKLSRQAREPEAYVPPSRIQTAGGPRMGPVLSRYERTRFRLTWMPGNRIGGPGYSFEQEDIAFRFVGDLPPGESGPYSSVLHTGGGLPRSSLGHITLAYAWSRQLAAEVELFIPRRFAVSRSEDLRFTSTLDGLSYDAYFGSYEVIRLDFAARRIVLPSGLAGVPPSPFHRTGIGRRPGLDRLDRQRPLFVSIVLLLDGQTRDDDLDGEGPRIVRLPLQSRRFDGGLRRISLGPGRHPLVFENGAPGFSGSLRLRRHLDADDRGDLPRTDGLSRRLRLRIEVRIRLLGLFPADLEEPDAERRGGHRQAQVQVVGDHVDAVEDLLGRPGDRQAAARERRSCRSRPRIRTRRR